MKKRATCLLVSVIALSACNNESSNQENNNAEKVEFNETGLPLVDEGVDVSLQFVSPKSALAPNFGEMTIFKEIENMTNVHINWNNIPGDGYAERKNLMLASNDLPDAFYNAGFSDYDLVRYGRDGAIIPLEGLIEEYAPNLQKILDERPELLAVLTAPDGHIYSLPRVEEMGLVPFANFTAINQAWLDEVGLEKPETLDELREALRAFREHDVNGSGKADEGLSFTPNDGFQGYLGDFFAAFGLPDNPNKLVVKDGEVIFTAVQNEYKEAIAYFHEWFAEGLIDQEVFTHDTGQFLAKGKQDPNPLGAFIFWEIESVVGLERAEDYVLLGPLEGPNGDRMYGRSNHHEHHRGAFVITSANENPELTMRWVDQLYDPHLSAQINWGPIGDIYEEDENGMLVNKELPEGITMGEFREKVAPMGPSVVLEEHFGTVVDMEPRAKQRLQDIETYYADFIWEESYPNVFMNEEELDRLHFLEADLMDVVERNYARWLMEGGVEEEWEAYVNQLYEMGLEEWLQIRQDAYDRYYEQMESQ
ncbi:sugar ABC transporter substrate-binding protein [Shouchella clausii]|uniref:ABC transporter substrate-binding protein n=1 Tax=Shouchella clausii TaxID=79880 RepID=UPI000794BE6B|nr:ABC transporter substrate-binding protein [Shouchella clausii]MCM3313149.1 ABC transporter substrate-binding protein [Psychrobacillus sp. MER TA 17]KKI87304.1 ABC transporter substrate-binding protein [Shouchella clausii]MDO7269935.1 ABC transporter substrate-binding protein [Shouchella clausii]MDO7286996.1 ABC transporter substrate-binding protein [Shouchella clausii]PAD45601.1 ABC transporter substrate-binding protein [Shouchella clausii]